MDWAPRGEFEFGGRLGKRSRNYGGCAPGIGAAVDAAKGGSSGEVDRLLSRYYWFLNGVVPVIGIAVLVYALYKSFFTSLWGAGFGLGQSVVLFAVFWSLVGIAYAIYLSRSRPDVLAAQSVVLEEQPELGFTAEVTTSANP